MSYAEIVAKSCGEEEEEGGEEEAEGEDSGASIHVSFILILKKLLIFLTLYKIN